METFVISDLAVTLALYFLLLGYFVKRRRPLLAGFIMLAVAFLGPILMAGVTNDDMPGTGILFFLLLPLPLLLIFFGIVSAIVRLIKDRRTPVA